MRRNGLQTYGRQTYGRHPLRHNTIFSPDVSSKHCSGLWNNRKVFDSSAESFEDSFDRLCKDSPSTEHAKKSRMHYGYTSIEAPAKPQAPWNNRKVFESSNDSSEDLFDKLLQGSRRSTRKTTRQQQRKSACKNKENQQSYLESSLDSLEADSNLWQPKQQKSRSIRAHGQTKSVTSTTEKRSYNLRTASKQIKTVCELSSDSDFCSFSSHRPTRSLKRPTVQNKQRQSAKKVKKTAKPASESKRIERPKPPELDYSVIDEWNMCGSPDIFKVPSPPIVHSPPNTKETNTKDLTENQTVLTNGSESLFDSSLTAPVKDVSASEGSLLSHKLRSAVGGQTSTPNFGMSGVYIATVLHETTNLLQNPCSFEASPIARSKERSRPYLLRSSTRIDNKNNPPRQVESSAITSETSSRLDPGEQARRNLEVVKKGLMQMQLASASVDYPPSADFTKAQSSATRSTANSQDQLKTAVCSLHHSRNQSLFENKTRFPVIKSPLQCSFNYKTRYPQPVMDQESSASGSTSDSTEEEHSLTGETSLSTSSSASLKSHKSQQHLGSTNKALKGISFDDDDDIPLSIIKDVLHLKQAQCKNGVLKSNLSRNIPSLFPSPFRRTRSKNNSQTGNGGEGESTRLDWRYVREISVSTTSNTSTSQAITESESTASVEDMQGNVAVNQETHPTVSQNQMPFGCEKDCVSMDVSDCRALSESTCVADVVIAVDNVSINPQNSSNNIPEGANSSSNIPEGAESEVHLAFQVNAVCTHGANQVNNSLVVRLDQTEPVSVQHEYSDLAVGDGEEITHQRPIPAAFELLVSSICTDAVTTTAEKNMLEGALPVSIDENESLSMSQKHLQIGCKSCTGTCQRSNLEHSALVSTTLSKTKVMSKSSSSTSVRNSSLSTTDKETKLLSSSCSQEKHDLSVVTVSDMNTPSNAFISRKQYLGSTDKRLSPSILKERIQLSWHKISESARSGSSITGSRPPSFSESDVAGKALRRNTSVVRNISSHLRSAARTLNVTDNNQSLEAESHDRLSQDPVARRTSKLHHNKEIHRRARKSLLVTLSPGFPKAAVISSRKIVLQHCNQLVPQRFEDFIRCFKKLVKIGEGAYGEVYSSYNNSNDSVAIKVIPIEGDILVNDEKQKTFSEVLPEIAISLTLSNLDNEAESNCTSNFVHLHSIKCVSGEYPTTLLRAWKKYDTQHASENDNPEIFSRDQLYMAFVFNNAGVDLERYEFCGASQAYSTFVQVVCTLAIAENAVEFEHRDLHWGNILISRTDNTDISFRLQGEDFQVLSHGIHVTLIDFTLSRLKEGRCVVSSNLSDDPYIFKGKGDYQFEVYRLMRSQNNDQWDSFCPYTNVLWLHYLLLKLCNEKKYPSRRRADRSYLIKLKTFCSKILTYSSATEFVESHLQVFKE